MREIARLASLGLPHAGSWLSVVPSPALGLHLRPAEFIPVLKYRLGVPVYSSAGLCPACSRPSDRMGDHSLGCRTTSDRIANVGAAASAGASLSKAYERKIKETAEACRVQGLVFLPFAMETLGGLHSGAAAQVKQLAAALARSKGLVEGEVTAQLFGKLSLTLMRGNALMISSRCQDDNFPPAEIDSVE